MGGDNLQRSAGEGGVRGEEQDQQEHLRHPLSNGAATLVPGGVVCLFKVLFLALHTVIYQ